MFSVLIDVVPGIHYDELGYFESSGNAEGHWMVRMLLVGFMKEVRSEKLDGRPWVFVSRLLIPGDVSVVAAVGRPRVPLPALTADASSTGGAPFPNIRRKKTDTRENNGFNNYGGQET